MVGPSYLNLDNISNIVTLVSPGAYVLSRNGQQAHYVGRSDTNLLERLKSWVGHINQYTHFWFEYANSAKEAFDLECLWAHNYLILDNQNHPARPSSSDWQCPNCNIFNTGRGWY